MSQNTQQSSHVEDTDLQPLPAACDDPLALVDTLKVVACPVCRAIYIPSGEQQTVAPTSADLLETAFLALCRSCFRCQRPACPQCWNPVHHTCAACSEEAHLPFRTPVPSLQGLAFLPPTSIHTKQENKISFICQRNGRFYMPEPAASRPQSQEVRPLPTSTASAPVTFDTLSAHQSDHKVLKPTANETYPTWLQEVLGQRMNEQDALPLATGEAQLEDSSNLFPTAEAGSIISSASGTNWPLLIPTTRQQTAPSLLAVLPAPAPTMQSLATTSATPGTENQNEAVLQDDLVSEESSLLERIENVLIIITSILLLAVILMIVLSISSAQVNAFFLHFLHIDIRTEIAYLLQLR